MAPYGRRDPDENQTQGTYPSKFINVNPKTQDQDLNKSNVSTRTVKGADNTYKNIVENANARYREQEVINAIARQAYEEQVRQQKFEDELVRNSVNASSDVNLSRFLNNRYEQTGEDSQTTKRTNATQIKQEPNFNFAKKQEQEKQEAQTKEQIMQDLKNRQAENQKLTDDSVLASFLAANGKSPNTAPAFGEVATYQEYFNRLKNGNSIDNTTRLNQERRDQITAEKASTGVNDVSATKDKLDWIKNKMKKKIDIQVTEAPNSMKAQLEREAREMASYKPFEILE